MEIEVAFGANLDAYEDHIEVRPEDLEGLPDEYVEHLAPGSQPGTHRVSLDYPEYQPFMRHARHRELRRELQRRFWNQAVAENRPLLEEAIAIRADIAALLGYDSWIDYSTEVKMAGSAQAVEEFYASLLPGLDAKAERELAELRAVAEDGEVQSWDLWYLDERLRQTRYRVDEHEVAAYFPLDRVWQGLFDLTGEVFDLEYRHVEEPSVWHPDVELYEIRDRGSDAPLAYFYADLFPRKGKFGHAAAFAVRYGRREDDGYRIPVGAIVANLTKPGPESPSLLRHDEVVTLFHEFGHILHLCLTKVELVRYSGYEAEWDFVEAPSQIMENWTWEPEVLARFARHHARDEPIPADLVERMVAARDLDVGLFTLRQVFLGALDLALHRDPPPEDLDVVYREAYRVTKLPFHEGTFFPAGFGHLMGGYDAGYYGYLWSMVYGDDMFSVFAANGVTNPDVGRRYRREILETGGSRDAMEHLRAFLGRDPSTGAFLRRLGIETAGTH